MATRKHLEYTATIDYLTRLNSSKYGNPRFLIHFVGGATAKTQPDAGISYSIDNRNHIGVPVTIRATPSGLVYDVEVLA